VIYIFVIGYVHFDVSIILYLGYITNVFWIFYNVCVGIKQKIEHNFIRSINLLEKISMLGFGILVQCVFFPFGSIS
jgi:hypothetical protein